MYWRLGKLEIMPTRLTLQLADRSITRPYGVIEDILVRVKHLIFPADFVVMDIEEEKEEEKEEKEEEEEEEYKKGSWVTVR